MAAWKRLRPQYADSQYGLVAKRRREQAILLIRLMLWFAMSLCQRAVAAFWDAHNAFPSVSWDSLDRGSLPLASEDDKILLWQRYRRSLSVLADGQGECLLVRPQQGDRQGDGPAAQRYILAMDGPLEELALTTNDIWGDIYGEMGPVGGKATQPTTCPVC